MRGSLFQRSPGSWTIVVSRGYSDPDPVTGKRKLKQKWTTFRGTKKEAQTKLNDMLSDMNKGEFVEPTKMTVREYLNEWVEQAVKPPAKRQSTYDHYKQIIAGHLIPALGDLKVQQLRPGHLERYFAEKSAKLAPATLMVHQAILHRALRSAVRHSLVPRNVAALVDGKPRVQRKPDDVLGQCWTVEECRSFLQAAKQAGPQIAALFALALDTGARKNELCGLKWSDVDLEAGRLSIVRQLVKPGRKPEFGPTKTGQPRTLDLNEETVRLLATHKKQQAELKMRNRKHYNDLGLVFAKEWGDVHRHEDSLGLPLQSNNLGQREFARVIKAAKVRAVNFHGLRHTCASLLLMNGEPLKVVQERLGHKRPEITLGIYAHLLPGMQRDAAKRLGALLHG
jgi:integrase